MEAISVAGDSDSSMGNDTHYVLVIHGTFDAPAEAQTRWYQLSPDAPQNFCFRLGDILRKAGLNISVCRDVAKPAINFHWSGANDHEARIVAAEELIKVIEKISSDDPSARIHLVGHSHGGNVI